MSSNWTVPARAIALSALLVACGGDDPTVVESEVEPPATSRVPDVAGSWLFSLVAYPVGSQTSSDGVCELNDLPVTLTKVNPTPDHYTIGGTHAAGFVACDDDAAEFARQFEIVGPNQASIPITAGSVQGSVRWTCIDITLVGACLEEGPIVELVIQGQLFEAGYVRFAVPPVWDQEVSTSRLAGDFGWYNTRNIGVLHGGWRARRP